VPKSATSEESHKSTKTQPALAVAPVASAVAWPRTRGVPRRTAFRWAKVRDVRKAVESYRRRTIDQAVVVDCQVRLCGRAAKKSFEPARIGAQEIGLVQIVLSEGFTKNGEDFEVVGLRVGLPTLSSRMEFILLWFLKHKVKRTGAMRCAPLGRSVRKGAAEVLKIAGNMECGRSGRSSRARKV
jgi:hypothetical protein